MPRSKKQPDFEDSLARLEAIVDQLESGELSLEQSLKVFEEGVALTRSCQKSLSDAEQKVRQLTLADGEASLEDFESEAADPDDE